MITTTLSDFRKNLKKHLDSVTNNFETLIINRGKETGVIIMSLKEYNSLIATQHELSSRKNEERLDSAIAKFNAGDSSEEKLFD